MTKQAFENLKVGEYVRTSKNGYYRRIYQIKKVLGKTEFIRLRFINLASQRLWSGYMTKPKYGDLVTYVKSDSRKFIKL